jgi:toxin ParE1/3/4
MTRGVTRTLRADIDLVSILVERAIAHSQRSAERLGAAIDKKCLHYARLPMTGIPCDDLAPGLRCFPVRPFLVFYRPTDDRIVVVRVVRGSRNIKPEMFTP